MQSRRAFYRLTTLRRALFIQGDLKKLEGTRISRSKTRMLGGAPRDNKSADRTRRRRRRRLDVFPRLNE